MQMRGIKFFKNQKVAYTPILILKFIIYPFLNRFTVILTDKNGNPIENSNRIPLSIGIYSSENPPKYIDSNTAGKNIFTILALSLLICHNSPLFTPSQTFQIYSFWKAYPNCMKIHII